jgi:hypothetical protein
MHRRTYLVYRNELVFQIDAQFEKLAHFGELDRFDSALKGLHLHPLVFSFNCDIHGDCMKH